MTKKLIRKPVTYTHENCGGTLHRVNEGEWKCDRCRKTEYFGVVANHERHICGRRNFVPPKEDY